MSAPKRGKDRIRELEAQIRGITESREHFRRSAERQKSRCHKLRHRQRALVEAGNIMAADASRFHSALWGDALAALKGGAT